jgi:Cft2 family RNA processing exonuclease
LIVRGLKLFAYSDHVHLPALDLALDPPRRAAFAFVSHGHTDHIGRHAAGVATPPTVALLGHRLGKSRLDPLAFHAPIERAGHRLWLEPAGHVLGAAQIVVEDPDGRRLVYTGDFSVRARPTVQAAVPVRTDVLITECTFGSPRYVFPSDAEIRERVRVFVERALADSAPPVVLGYALGKAQEAMALVSSLGFPVRAHRRVADLAAVYERFGVGLGPYAVYDGMLPAGEVLIAPPSALQTGLPRRARTLYLSGWALDRATKYRMGVDEAIPLSDHADFAELVQFVAAAQPTKVYTTHGPACFADHLRRLGFDAQHLGDHQPALF